MGFFLQSKIEKVTQGYKKITFLQILDTNMGGKLASSKVRIFASKDLLGLKLSFKKTSIYKQTSLRISAWHDH